MDINTLVRNNRNNIRLAGLSESIQAGPDVSGGRETMKFRYITIEREYGSGGTKIGRRLSEVCGVPCYGKEILEAVAKKHGIPVEDINRYEEKATGSLIYSMFVMSRVQTGDPSMLTAEGKVFLDEQLEIRRLAMEGPSIFLGHCAADALREQNGVVKVFIHSGNEEEVKNRITKDYGIAPEEVESTRRYYNKKRAGYFRANTGKEWKDLKNYDIVLDSSKLGIEGCVNVLKGVFE